MIPLPIEVLAAIPSGKPSFDKRPIYLGMCGAWQIIVAGIISYKNKDIDLVEKVLRVWTRPIDLAEADIIEVIDLLRKTNRYVLRATNLISMSKVWISGQWTDARDLPGVGIYVADCIGLFCLGCIDIESKDKTLLSYIKGLNENFYLCYCSPFSRDH